MTTTPQAGSGVTPSEIQQALVTLRAVSEWLESSVSYGSSSPDEPPQPQSEFDYRLSQAAAEISNVANRIESATAGAGGSVSEVLKDAASMLRKYHRLCVGSGKGDGFWLARILEVEAACRAAATPAPEQATPAQSVPAGGEVPESVHWGYAETVGNFILQLQTLEPTLPIHGVVFADIDGKKVPLVKGVILSNERIEGRHFKTGDASVPYSAVVWASDDQRATQPPTPQDAAPVAEVLIGNMTAILYDALPVGTKLYAAPAVAVEAVQWSEKEFDEILTQRDHREEIIDALCDAVLGPDREEWSSAYYVEDAVTEVQERMEELEARAGCRESNASTPPVVQPTPGQDAKDARRLEVLGYELQRERFRSEQYFKVLMGIFNLLNPEATKLGDGRVMKFINPYANEVLDRLSSRIRSIKADLDAAAIQASEKPPAGTAGDGRGG